MAKTDLTRRIESALVAYDPAEQGGVRINKFRARHAALEVPADCGTTIGGLVDCVGIAECFLRGEPVNCCRPRRNRWALEVRKGLSDWCATGELEGPEADYQCPETDCTYNITCEVGIPDVMITCYEIKISKADFKSANGHNFVGNCNYYVAPKALYPEVVDMVPDDIGVIMYLDNGSLRRKKDCTFQAMTDEDQKWMILSVMKRMRRDNP